MIRNDDQEKLFQLEKKNLRYLNLFRLFAGLFFFALLNNDWVANFYPSSEFHPATSDVIDIYLMLSISIMIITYVSQQERVIRVSKLTLFLDLVVLIFLAFATNGFSQGVAILPVLAIGSAAMLYRRPFNILLAPTLATILLWLLPEVLDFSNQEVVTDSSKWLHALGYFVIALLGIRQSISYTSTLSLYKSQRKTISGLENMNQVIIEKLTNGVIIYQNDHVILHANQSAKKLLDNDDIIFFPPEILDFLESNKDGAVYTSDNGSDLYLRKASVSEEKNFGVLFIEDSSYLKKAAQQLNLASLGKLSSSIAHEIRNPLAAISTAAELLVESPDLKDQDKQISEIIVNQTRRANHIIEDILEMSKRRTAEPETLDIADYLSLTKKQLIDQGLANSQQIQLIGANNKTIEFDPDHFKQVVWNLASNAIKHGIDNELQIIVREQTIEFRNNGEAFDAKKIKNLFEPFFTTHNRGTGLGLHICRQLCHDNHATLDYLHLNNQHVFRIEFNLG
ncbi:HAMP domain-containing sensor histidine kinase [Marinicella sp. S1101]|uniref:sensor histidine kinase n=1 Tax=Marinicella marina TaxID=2996016 RepID=UPI0022610342|nr:HAMP domain-containing sensor histidine kinase [Marinicella marina]MCX7552842.1 HAMP domain-containing sensor histidine kinase [Marinicella marina]MDJ1139849.1 HAMP domain-containing sensor histidine kinase [Marinicella marina]